MTSRLSFVIFKHHLLTKNKFQTKMFMTQQQQQTLPKIIEEIIIRMNSLEGQTTSKNWK